MADGEIPRARVFPAPNKCIWHTITLQAIRTPSPRVQGERDEHYAIIIVRDVESS